jgi:hypothetical protein
MSCIAAAAVIALVIEAIQTTLSSRKVRVAKSGGLFDRPEACHPIEYDAKREAEITHLNVVLRLLRAREQSRGQRAHLRQGGDLIGQLMHWDIAVLGARHQEYVSLSNPQNAGPARGFALSPLEKLHISKSEAGGMRLRVLGAGDDAE